MIEPKKNMDHVEGASSEKLKRLREFMYKKENHFCADCGAPEPKWASANIGVFICLKCSDAHRSLGVHISKVLSVTLGDWEDDEIDAMIEVGGNVSANAIYEAFMPKSFPKPTPDSTHEKRLGFIRSKYLLQEFLKPSLRIVSRRISTTQNNVATDATVKPSAPMNMVGMVGYIGSLKIKVVRGIHLAVRDMRSSDPYVVLSIGEQKVQTKVISSNLNPIWNEELRLSVPEKRVSVKLKVFDYDTISADDIMGEAEIDVQPLVTAATAFTDPTSLGDVQIGKWLASKDNALLDDSIISIVDGRVKQDVHLKLQNVESGEIELQLEWVPMDQ